MKQYANNREKDWISSLFISVAVVAALFGCLFFFGFAGFAWMLLVLIVIFAYIVLK